MDVKIITSFLLWFCLIASLSISQTASARLDSRQRFRRQNDESIACPEGTKPCKDDNTMCVVYCNGNPECADGSDEIDCATNTSASSSPTDVPATSLPAATGASMTSVSSAADAPVTTVPPETDAPVTSAPLAANASSTSLSPATNASVPSEPIVIVQSTESIGIEIERANVPQTTTDITEAAAVTTVASEAGTATAILPDGVTIAFEGTTATKEAETAAAEVQTGTAILPDGATIVFEGTTATKQAETTSAEVQTGTAILPDGATIAFEGTTATVVAETATETVEPAATGIVVDGTTIGSATVEAVTADVTGINEAAEGATTASDANLETSTIVVVDNGTDVFTSVKPGNGHGAEQDNDTTSADNVSDQVTTIEAITIDSNGTATADNGTATDAASDVTTVSLDDVATGNDTLWTTTLDSITVDENATQPNITEEATTPAPVPPPSERVELRVVVSPEILQVQYGQSYVLTCGVYGADANTNIYWIQEEPERRYALIDQPGPNDKQVTMSQVSLTARITIDDRSKIGKYTCTAHDAAGNSGSAILTMQEGGAYNPRPVPPYPGTGPSGGGGYLRIVAPDMAEGDYVEIQCEGASPDDEGRIQWFFNNELLSDQQPLYPRGKTLHIRPISRAYLGSYRCSIPGSSYADANSVLTFGGPTGPSYGGAFSVTVQIVQGQTAQGQAQEGSQVVLRCQPSEQASGYRWTFTSSQGTIDRGYSDQIVLPGVTGRDSGVYTCQATSARGQSATGSVNLYVTSGAGPVSGRCSIDEATCRNGRCIPRAYLYDGKNDCGDNSDEAGPSGFGADACQPNEIRCTNSDRGRKCVQKFWMCDGDRDCDDGSDEDQRYCDLLPRQRYCKPSEFHCGGPNATSPNPVCIPRSFQCDGYNDCPDRSDEVGCVKPTVVSAPQRQIQINVGQTLNIQCTARGSPAPYINWRLNWGPVCGDGSDGGRCVMSQTIDPSDPSLVTGTLTVRNVNVADGGAYSCEALNNQGFIFAIPDAIVDVIINGQPQQPCNCNGHSSSCSPDGRCVNCQHNTVGYNCEFCASGYQGDARRGSPQDCQPIGPVPSFPRCDPSGTHMERSERCICKYNVEGDQCNQCKRSHFYLNPTTPNGCLPCFCSGVSTDCTSTSWRRQANALPLNNWNAVPKTFATDRYEAGNRIQQRNGGREIALDQSSLGRPSDEVLYWKAPKENLGDVVTLYDGNIDIHFTNDAKNDQAPNDNEFIWLRGNNIDLIHKLPQGQQFKANTNTTYSVPVNERTFTRKDGTYIDRENILMALSDLDTLLVKINPIGGRKNAVLSGVTLNVAARDGYSDPAPTVESCSCPANYTGSSCEKCAEGYGRPHPLVGIYLGQCWSCRSLCNERSDQCDRETGKCADCQGNSEGDRCERCRSGYVLDGRSNQCVPQDQYDPSYGPGTSGGYYVDQKPYDVRGVTPITIVLDGNQSEQRVPLQVLNAQPQSVVWGRTDGSALPPNVVQEGNDLVFRNPSAEQGGNYIATITHPNGIVDHVSIYLQYRPGQGPPTGPGYGLPVFSPQSPLILSEGSSQLIQPQGAYYQVQWRRGDGQPLPSGVYQNGNALQISNARPDQSGTYYCELYGVDGTPNNIPYQIHVRAADRPHHTGGGPPRINIEPKTINLKEGQRMIVQYTVSSHDPIEVVWNKRTDQGYQPIPSLFTVEPNRLVLNRAVPEAAGTYQVVVRNQQGEDKQELTINVEPRRGRGRGQQGGAPQVRFQQSQYDVGYGEVIDITPTIYGGSGATITWSKDGSAYLPEGITARSDGSLRVEGRSSNIDGRYTLDVSSAYGRVSSPIDIRWKESSGQYGGYGNNQDNSRGYQDAGGYDHGDQQGGDQQQAGGYVEVTIEPSDATLARGEKVNLTCRVKGTEQFTVTWGKYAHDTSLPNYARQEGNSVIVAPTDDSTAEQMYLQCSVNVPDQPQPYLAYAPVTIRGNDESRKKRKKRSSQI